MSPDCFDINPVDFSLSVESQRANNLGGIGPDVFGPEEMRYHHAGEYDGTPFDVAMRIGRQGDTGYDGNPDRNGVKGDNIAQINVKLAEGPFNNYQQQPRRFELIVTFEKSYNRKAIYLPATYLTLYDWDFSGRTEERLCFNVEDVVLENSFIPGYNMRGNDMTLVTVEELACDGGSGRSVVVQSNSIGTGSDNPSMPLDISAVCETYGSVDTLCNGGTLGQVCHNDGLINEMTCFQNAAGHFCGTPACTDVTSEETLQASRSIQLALRAKSGISLFIETSCRAGKQCALSNGRNFLVSGGTPARCTNTTTTTTTNTIDRWTTTNTVDRDTTTQTMDSNVVSTKPICQTECAFDDRNVGDNYCDAHLNTCGCDFDGGDCCGPWVDLKYCDASSGGSCGCCDPSSPHYNESDASCRPTTPTTSTMMQTSTTTNMETPTPIVVACDTTTTTTAPPITTTPPSTTTTTTAVPEPACFQGGATPTDFVFDAAKLTQNNLGGIGPDTGVEEMRYENVGKFNNQNFDVVLSIERFLNQAYRGKPELNGGDGMSDRLASISVQVAKTTHSGNPIDLRVEFQDHSTHQPITLPYAYLSVLDIDSSNKVQERVCISPDEVSLENSVIPGYNVAFVGESQFDIVEEMIFTTENGLVGQTEKTWCFESNAAGYMCDNPEDPFDILNIVDDNICPQLAGQVINLQDRAVMLALKSKSSITLRLQAMCKDNNCDDNSGRTFLLAGRVSLANACAYGQLSPTPTCPTDISFQEVALTQNNLDGAGPDEGAEEIRYSGAGEVAGENIDVVFKVTDYLNDPYSFGLNGGTKASINGYTIDGVNMAAVYVGLNNVTLARNPIEVEVGLVASGTDDPVEVEAAYLTFLDLKSTNNVRPHVCVNLDQIDLYNSIIPGFNVLVESTDLSHTITDMACDGSPGQSIEIAGISMSPSCAAVLDPNDLSIVDGEDCPELGTGFIDRKARSFALAVKDTSSVKITLWSDCRTNGNCKAKSGRTFLIGGNTALSAMLTACDI